MNKLNKHPGSYLIIQINGSVGVYIAEVLQEDPLILKVEEEGPYSRLKSGDYIIDEELSRRIQYGDDEQDEVLHELLARGQLPRTGLASLGVKDGELHEVSPGPSDLAP